ncbi:MAG: AzlC family ABC transporter permease [Burkholderiaceae bacterium]
MFFLSRYYRHPAFRVGVQEFLRTAPGIAAWGLMTGVAMVKSGIGLFESVLMALLVFAGSSQLAAVPLILAGAPLWVIWATGFCVNLRFVVFSLHLHHYMTHLPTWQRVMTGYFTADLSYVLFVRRYPHPAPDAQGKLAEQAYLAGSNMVNWGSWIGASLAGVALANFIPQSWGLGFAGILCLIGILCSLTTTRLRILSAVVASVVAVAAFALPLKLNIIVAIGAATLLCLTMEHWRGATMKRSTP